MTYFHPSGFPKAILVFLFLAALMPGCERREIATPYQGTPPSAYSRPQTYSQPPGYSPPQTNSRPQIYSPPQTYSQPASRSGGPVEVVEKSFASLGGPKTIYHELGPMETIWRVSRMYDVTPESILSANKLGPNDPLQVGQTLVVPNARTIRNIINLYRNSQWKYIILHHTATGKGNAKTIHRAHWARGFFNGLGYHFLIDNGTLGKGDGQIEMSPRWIRQQCGAHCKANGMNERAIGSAWSEISITRNQPRTRCNLLHTWFRFFASIMGYLPRILWDTVKYRAPKPTAPGNCSLRIT